MIDVRGRGLVCTRITVIHDSKGVKIRVDDDGKGETWITVYIPRGDLIQMVSLSMDAEACEEAEARYQAAKRTLPGMECPPG